MTYNEFLKNLEGKTLYHFLNASGVNNLSLKEKIGYTKCELNFVGTDFLVLNFVKESMFTSNKTLAIPLGLVVCELLPEKA